MYNNKVILEFCCKLQPKMLTLIKITNLNKKPYQENYFENRQTYIDTDCRTTRNPYNNRQCT